MNNRSEHVRFLPIYYSLYPGPAEFEFRYRFVLVSSRSASNSLRPHSLIRWFPTSQVAIHASSKRAEASFRAGVSRAHWDYFCWTVRFDTSPGEHGQSTGLAECEMVHVTSGSERRDWPVIRALWLLLLSYKVRKMAKKCRLQSFSCRYEDLIPKHAPESGFSKP